VTEYLILFAVVLGINLLPAFGPPTWTILVLYGLNSELPVAPAIFVAALAAALGRYLLAHAFRRLGTKIPERYRRNLVTAREAFESRRRAKYAALGLFALSPLPSAQLFEAAGLTGVRLGAFTTAFFSGRLVSYSIYTLSARALRAETLGDTFWETLRSPFGLAAQLVMIAALIALARIDWSALRKNTNDAKDKPDLGSSAR
jgi:uncharacterized membrane protein YdjX (TVP38/TMEM64 family)